MQLLNLDIWRSTPHALDLRLPTSQTHLLDAFLPANTPAGVLIPDVQHLVDLSSLSAAPESAHEVDETWDVADLSTAFHDGYHPLRDMYAFGEALVVGFPGVVEGFEVGRSAEGRAIRGWRAHIANGTGEQSRRGKGVREGNEILEIIIQAGQHAREVIIPTQIR